MNQDNQKVSVVRCLQCDSPVVREAGCCKVCGQPLTGKEPEYLLLSPQRPMIKPLLQQWLIICGVLLLLSGFSPGIWMTILLAGVSAYYALKIVKRME